MKFQLKITITADDARAAAECLDHLADEAANGELQPSGEGDGYRWSLEKGVAE